MVKSSAIPSRPDSPFAVLRREREKLQLTLEDLELKTKISRRFLAAIEDGRFHELPGGIFNLSYLRQYARAVGCEPEALVTRYRAEFEQSPPPSEQPAPKQRHQPFGFFRLFSF